MCLSSHSGLCLPLCLSFLTLKSAHPPGQALRPVLCGHVKWAVTEMVVSWMELTVAVSGMPWVCQCSDTLTPHKGVLQEEGREVLCGSWKRGIKIPLLSVLTSRKKGPEAAQPAERCCLATRETLLQTHQIPDSSALIWEKQSPDLISSLPLSFPLPPPPLDSGVKAQRKLAELGAPDVFVI